MREKRENAGKLISPGFPRPRSIRWDVSGKNGKTPLGFSLFPVFPEDPTFETSPSMPFQERYPGWHLATFPRPTGDSNEI